MLTILSILLVVFLMGIVFRLSWFLFKFCGKLLGFLLGSVGFVIIGILAVTVISLAFFALPIILILGIAGLIGLAAKMF
ncbi:MAG: hypothetical protein MJ153_00230 [Clostridia bacterium]|nr:hypothetical protein [Clostridia bacterium]